MARCTLAVLVAVGALVATEAAYCHGAPKPGKFPNLNPISDNNGVQVRMQRSTTPAHATASQRTSAPAQMRVVPGGKAMKAGPPGAEFWVAHVWAKESMYEYGYAQGLLFKEEAQQVINRTWIYMEQQVKNGVDFLPPWLQDIIAEVGLEVALGLTYDLTVNYTTPGYYEEMKGFADAAELDYTKMRDIMLIGSLTQGDCSMYGSWGEASAGGKTLQLRALDWDTDNPAVSFPSVTVYHPDPSNPSLGNAFANVGFIGWIGTLTGQNAKQVAVSEIGVSFPDKTFGNMSRVGVPFTYLLRDILQFDSSLEEAKHRIQTVKRTCDLILGVGDGKAGMVNAVQYSSSVANFFNDTNLEPLNATWHPRMKNMVYEGMDWNCPAYQKALHDQLQDQWGKLSPENSISNVTANVQTGDVHLAVYDLTEQDMYVSFMRPEGGTGEQYAYQRPFTRLDLDKLFAEPAPTKHEVRSPWRG